MPRKVDFDKQSKKLCEKVALGLLRKAGDGWDKLSDKEKDRVVGVIKHVLPKKGVERGSGKKYEDFLEKLK